MNWQIRIFGGDDPDTQFSESRHECLYGFFIAGNGTGAEDDRIAGFQLEIRMRTSSQSAQGRSGFTLTAGGHGQDFIPGQIAKMSGIDQLVSRIPQAGGGSGRGA